MGFVIMFAVSISNAYNMQKLDNIMNNYYLKLDKSGLSFDKKIYKLNDLVEKIEYIKVHKNYSKNIINILNYVEENVKIRINYYKFTNKNILVDILKQAEQMVKEEETKNDNQNEKEEKPCPLNMPNPIALCGKEGKMIVTERDENWCAIKYGCEKKTIPVCPLNMPNPIALCGKEGKMIVTERDENW